MGLTELCTATPLQWLWLLAESSALQAGALEVKRRFASAKDARLAALFGKSELTELEAVALVTASVDQFLTPEQAWAELSTVGISSLARLRVRAQQRPCSRKDLEVLNQELDECLGSLRNQREKFRSREPLLLDPPGLLEVADRVRVALRCAFAEHDSARALVQQVRQLVDRGHIRRAVNETAAVFLKVSGFTDLDLSFVKEAERKRNHTRQRLLSVGAILITAIIFTVVIIKFLARPVLSAP